MADPQETTGYSIISYDSGAATRVLLTELSDGFSLPAHPHFEAAAINSFIQRSFGLDVITLECFRESTQGLGAGGSRVFVHEIRTPPPANFRHGAWLSARDLTAVPFAVPEHRAVLRAWFEESASTECRGRRLPWARPGWFADASTWIAERLVESGLSPTGRVQQVDSRLWSALLRVPTTAGGAYFKAVPPVFRHEPALTRLLGERFPAQVPTVLAVDAERGWMLTEDFGPESEYADTAEIVEAYTQVMPVLARMQVALAADADKLVALGCPRRPAAVLPKLYEELLADTEMLYLDDPNGLGEDEYERLRKYVGEFTATTEQLAGAPIPETLVHGDAWRGNFLSPRPGAGPLIFDWAESSVGHPFLTLAVVYRDVRESVPAEEAESAIVRIADAYLAEWTQFADESELREILRLSVTAGIVNRAIEWRNSVAELDPDRAMFYRYAVPVNLRRLLPFIAG
ncbi:phosphotransferase [Micromonospora noduli]|uniref:Aminoglycoside phosphotransferase domain-containing protein n=1 Tax=Micromonospora noduli TaxID=709876 RepID=A0A328N6T9_9ACTN|nr:phosphotransferase [Micromonospora noduli]RAO04205.1 hypothetical protein LAH08_01553 [Micromonospora noduli]RAO12518.1 hypothetical protein GUI43_02772 [Micromonospora noduli]RAO25337.1 hypothetical protein MED15_01100 [Micromonospora noduli]RAO32709.1 hypothetical protein ONO23_03127 [Micromonospora noduli]RAO53891.1 hypothetical protein ONO86_01397 [Micromonospora noduli]